MTSQALSLGSSDFAIDDLPESVRQMSLLPETPQKKDVPPSGLQVAHFGTTELLATPFQFPNTHCVVKPPDFVEPQLAESSYMVLLTLMTQLLLPVLTLGLMITLLVTWTLPFNILQSIIPFYTVT